MGFLQSKIRTTDDGLGCVVLQEFYVSIHCQEVLWAPVTYQQ